jgi:Big-like domain-containing protein
MSVSTLRRFVHAVAAAASIGLSACGGGGGGGGGVSPNPVLSTTMFSTNENVALSGTLSAKDPSGSAVTFAMSTGPKSGTLSGFTAAGQFVYTPNRNFTGSDSFSVTATDAAGNMTTSMISITVTVNQPPVVTADTVVRADPNASGTSTVNVLTNATDPDKDKLTVAIVPNSTLVGTATVNSDGSVSISGLTGFKGVTRFDYTVTDPSNASATGHAAVFVGESPFRAAFVADATGNGAYEVYLSDFASNPVAVTTASSGTTLKGFAVSDNGATVVYRTQNTSNSAVTSLSFVQTATPGTQVAISLPSGVVPVTDASGRDQFIVSPDGNWIALIAGQGGTNSLYVLNVSQPAVVTAVIPSGAEFATQPTFSVDSKNIYFLATSVAAGTAKSLYFVTLTNPSAIALVSAASNPAKSDDIYAYSVASDQSRIAELANRNGGVGLFFIDPAHLQVENQINETLSFGQSIAPSGSSTVGLPPGLGGSPDVKRVAYRVQNPPSAPSTDIDGVYVAEVSTTPNPRSVVRLDSVIGLRSDDAALLYTDGAQVFEAIIDSGTPGQSLGVGTNGWYDSTGNIVLLQNPLSPGAPLSSGSTLSATVRGSFGSNLQVGNSSLTTYYVDVSGFPQAAAAIIGQGPATGGAPTTARLGIVNALAPTAVYYLTQFQSPLQLSSYASKIVE